ncbi:phosphoenolpyruvate-protein phosphotransferase [Thermosinus carboxydivorans Nor1]|uniref:Phosphoenolpyruvate-protein phosphotransferase n=1 Tax=Thermosinus carboxydivorans Nor1 TaxID=401526 RepID=A1HLX3_9FIRM|nr:phosphoenolpyruvate--protein phosphotransferase [Thermosinus carboxydivorans]EAX48826.1 phosphoenolpyruvate-protein phosphotransferase [Thermosinus carboxydivorans Nor1]
MQYRGIAAAPGYALGTAFLLQEKEIPVIKQNIAAEDTGAEIDRLEKALCQAIREIEKIQEETRQKLGDDKAAIFAAHIMLLTDPEYIGNIKQKIVAEAINAEAAVKEVTDHFLNMFACIEDEYLRERAADLRDVSQRLLKRLQGIQSVDLADIAENVILCAHDLTPSDTAQLDRNKVVGFVTNSGGRTSHSAIMARSLEIPAVVGLMDITAKVRPGDFVIVDGNEGTVFINPPNELIEQYREKKAQFIKRQKEAKKLVNEPSITLDGTKVELVANIGNPEDAKWAVANGAEGIGLFRTEFLYMGRNELPSEEEQFEAYKTVVTMFGAQRPIVIRTLDIGGDKELSYMDMPKEKNPFLGYRAIRLCLDRPEIFKTQLRAILRASAYGNIKLMYPMIATLQELRAANQILEAAKQELASENIPFNTAMEVGIMVEIPAVAVLADQFATEVDFFSIGTNDLIQYTMAADRMNEKVSYLYQPFNPAVLRLIQGVIAAAHKAGKWVGMCGEMAGDLAAIPILLGMGLDEFSMSANAILPARALLRQLTQKDAQRIAQAVLKMDDAKEIRDFVEQAVSAIVTLR